MDLLLKGISHRYGETDVLSGIDLAVREGEIVCIIGPSGCGKSTLLRFIGGLERPDAGEVLVAGEAPQGSLNPLTYVFQDFALLPWRSVEGNISLVLEDHPLDARQREEIIADVLARTGLSDFRKAVPRQLSGGMRQRAALARTLVIDPDVILLDEPFSALDAQTKIIIQRNFAATIEQENITTLLITHDLAEAAFMADRILVLSQRPGTIVEEIRVDLPDRGNPTARRQNPKAQVYINRMFEILKLKDQEELA